MWYFIIALLCIQSIVQAKIFDNNLIAISGYIKYDAYIDSRQVVGSSDNYNLFYPVPRQYDSLGVDINRHGQTNLVTLASRTKLTFNSPVMHNCTSKACIEVDINGRGTTLQVQRVRHAFVEVEGDWWKVIVGHTWHPFYKPPHTPAPIANNAGQPFETYVRHPQIRFVVKKNNSSIVFAILEQVDFLSDGPQGPSSTYIRNSMLPELHVQLQQSFASHWFSVCIDFKRIVPRLVTQNGCSVVEHVNSIIAGFMLDFCFTKWTCKTKLIYAENGSEMSLIGGYAVRAIDGTTDYRTYTPLRSVSWWGECRYAINNQLQPALFVGYAYNLGSRHVIITDLTDSVGAVIDERVFGFGTNIQHLVRFSPRIRYTINSVELCAEVEYTHAWQGSLQTDGKIHNTDNVGVIRGIIGMFYYF
ncbi:hypothetical protein EKK58_06295 [Candidatus Dependentiae bacterium]|nr:MAG: hypothetical protein EKK58_06295 [Candidatus Dependentiae bacterium]